MLQTGGGNFIHICGLYRPAAEQLWNACEDGNLEVIQAVVNSAPQDQRVALLRAEDPDDSGRPSHLSSECLQPNGTGLHKAAWNGHSAIVNYLIEMGAEVEARNKVDERPEWWLVLVSAPL
jgi:hypothetical protein